MYIDLKFKKKEFSNPDSLILDFIVAILVMSTYKYVAGIKVNEHHALQQIHLLLGMSRAFFDFMMDATFLHYSNEVIRYLSF